MCSGFRIIIQDIHSSVVRHLNFLIVDSKHSSGTKFWIKGRGNPVFSFTVNFYKPWKML